MYPRFFYAQLLAPSIERMDEKKWKMYEERKHTIWAVVVKRLASMREISWVKLENFKNLLYQN